MHVPFGLNNIFLVPFGLNLANAHCGSWGQRVREFLQNARTLWPEQHFPRTLWPEFGERPVSQLGPKGTRLFANCTFFGLDNTSLVPFGLNLANVHCGSWGQRVRDFLRNARTPKI